ncbi:hypothetical protein PQX77_002094 [Marasmius sp. AFHP31]|nr:hypothetical protein PQX77_002094 [Marasmius sp. AFHP31]
MAGLAPTLMIVRIAYGKQVDSVQQTMSIHFAERETRASRRSGTRGTMDICPRSGVQTSEPGDTQLADPEAKTNELWAI